jgi:SAM-dependent methyltransferase
MTSTTTASATTYDPSLPPLDVTVGRMRRLRGVLPRLRDRGPPTAPPPVDTPSHRQRVGGLWEELGRLQLELLVHQGLEPSHYLLDIGCGSLRGGVRFIQYLDPGRYYGIDIDEGLLNAGETELRAAGLLDKLHTLRQTTTFDLDFGRPFDFALAQSVFTHLPMNSIQRCVMNVERVLAPSGAFFATFFPVPPGTECTADIVHPCREGLKPVTTYLDQDPYHYEFTAFEWLCSRTSLAVENLGEWGHPRGQHLLAFRHKTAQR